MGFMVVDLGELCSRTWRGSPGAPEWSPPCAGCSGTLTHPGARGSPVPSARSVCAMSRALDPGLKPGVDGCLSVRMTYEQIFSFSSAIGCAFAMFVLGKGGIVGLKRAEVAAATVPPTRRRAH